MRVYIIGNNEDNPQKKCQLDKPQYAEVMECAEYALPTGYIIAQTHTGCLRVYNALNVYCPLYYDNATGKVLLIDTSLPNPHIPLNKIRDIFSYI